MIKLGIVAFLAAGLLAYCANDGEGCEEEEEESLRPVALVQGAPVARTVAAAQQLQMMPASGGFGTHLASCGG